MWNSNKDYHKVQKLLIRRQTYWLVMLLWITEQLLHLHKKSKLWETTKSCYKVLINLSLDKHTLWDLCLDFHNLFNMLSSHCSFMLVVCLWFIKVLHLQISSVLFSQWCLEQWLQEMLNNLGLILVKLMLLLIRFSKLLIQCQLLTH